MTTLLPTRALRRALLSCTAVVSLLGLGVELLHHLRPALRTPLIPVFSLSMEGNLPTWYAALLLSSCGLLLLCIAAGAAQAREPSARRWTTLGVVFLYLSLDEAAELHEHLGDVVQLHGVLYFSWVVPAGALVLLLGLWYLPFLRHLPRDTRWRFVLAGALYVGGALGLELPLGYWAERAGRDNLVYSLLDWLEETLELLGATLFLLSLLRYLSQRGPLRLQPTDGVDAP